MLGVGAGLVNIPILLMLGIYPMVASATSSIMYIFITGTGIISTIANGSLSTYELLWYLLLSFIGGLVFGKLTYFFVNKYNARYVVVLITFIIALANVFCVIYYVYKI